MTLLSASPMCYNECYLSIDCCKEVEDVPKIDTADFKNGVSIMQENEIFTIVWFQHHKPGKGGAVMRTKLRNLRTGGVVDRTFNAGEKFEQAILDRYPMQFLYKQDDEYVLMHPETKVPQRWHGCHGFGA
jgi:translation elongation factor P/translation initiation factor 5A